LAALRPARKGERRNPEGRNQATKEREAWSLALALVRAIDAAPTEERRAELLERLLRQALDAGLAGDRRVAHRLLAHLWPVE